MKAHLYLLFISAVFTGTLSADTIILKTGVTYEGQIISQDEESYLIAIRVTQSIKDERRLTKDEIKEIIKESADAKDFVAVKALVPTPDRLSEKSYAARIATAHSFLTKYPKSTHTKAAQGILKKLKKEQLIISQGGIKLSGQLISKSDIEANAYDIHARMILNKMKKLATTGDYQQALRHWETLQGGYAHSSSYRDGATFATQVLRSYSSELKNLIYTMEPRMAKRKLAMGRLSEDDRLRTIHVLAENQKKYAALIEHEEKQLQTKWLTIDPQNSKALEYNLRNAESALSNLSSFDASQVKLAGPAYRGAWSTLAEGNLEGAAKHLQVLNTLDLPEKYIQPLAKQLAEKQATATQAEEKAKEEAAIEKALQERLAKEAAEKEAAEKNKNKPRKKRRNKTQE